MPAAAEAPLRNVRRLTVLLPKEPCHSWSRHRSPPSGRLVISLVDLLELAVGPLHRVLRLHALDALGVHVGDDVLGEGLGGLGVDGPA
jgi:hypothetical protein